MIYLLVAGCLLLLMIYLSMTPLIWTWLGRPLKMERLSYVRAFFACLVVTLVGGVAVIVPLKLALFSESSWLPSILFFVAGLVLALLILKLWFRTTVGNAATLQFSSIVLVAFFVLFVCLIMVKPYRIPSGAMENTIQVGDNILVNKYQYLFGEPVYGDIIVFDFPGNPRLRYIKRVVAVGGDTLEIRDKVVHVNGEAQASPFVKHVDSRIFSDSSSETWVRRDNYGPIKVPEDKLFVMGDNRDSSNDSRYWGFVDLSAVRGKAFFVYWSWDRQSNFIRYDRIGKSL